MKVFYINYDEGFIISRNKLLEIKNNNSYKIIFNKIEEYKPTEDVEPIERYTYNIDKILSEWDIIQLTEEEIRNIYTYHYRILDNERIKEIDKLRELLYENYIDIKEC